MTDPISPMARLNTIFTMAYIIAAVALILIDVALDAAFDFVLPGGAAIGAQIGVAYYAGHRYGQETLGLPDKGWFWTAGLYTTLISIAVSIVFGILAFFLLTSADEREVLSLMFSGGTLEDDMSGVVAATVALVVIIMVLWIAISVVAHRFIMAHAASKSFDLAKTFS